MNAKYCIEIKESSTHSGQRSPSNSTKIINYTLWNVRLNCARHSHISAEMKCYILICVELVTVINSEKHKIRQRRH